MADKVYIKLNDSEYLYVGDFDLALDMDTKDAEFNWSPAAVIGIKSSKSGGGDFKRVKTFDGYEFEIPERFQKSIIKKILDGKDA